MNQKSLNKLIARIDLAYEDLYNVHEWRDQWLKGLYHVFYYDGTNNFKVSDAIEDYDADGYPTQRSLDKIKSLFIEWLRLADCEVLSKYFNEHQIMEMFIEDETGPIPQRVTETNVQ